MHNFILAINKAYFSAMCFVFGHTPENRAVFVASGMFGHIERKTMCMNCDKELPQ